MKTQWKTGGMVVMSMVLALAGCSGSNGGGGEGTEGISLPEASLQAASNAPKQPFLVRVKEFSVAPSPKKLSAGTVEFMVLNQGTEFHEFVVVKTDLAIADLPTNDDGSFDEEGDGVEVIDEIEMIDPGTMERLTVTLESGHYVILCNRVEVEEDGEIESHFMEGMSADLNVD